MKISVVTIVYNDVQHIETTLKNVLEQTARDSIEYIVVDGASTDGTSEIILRYIKQIDKYICERDSGIYNAMNKGLSLAEGDYITFMNCGDRYSSLSTVEQIIKAIPDSFPDVVYGNYRETDGDKQSKIIPCRHADKIWYGPVASHQSVFYRLEHLRDNGIVYDETYRIAADYKLTAEAIKAAESIQKTDICVCDFETSGVSSTNQNAGLWEANRVRREIFGWGDLRIGALTIVLLFVRYAKKYTYPVYSILRNRHI